MSAMPGHDDVRAREALRSGYRDRIHCQRKDRFEDVLSLFDRL